MVSCLPETSNPIVCAFRPGGVTITGPTASFPLSETTRLLLSSLNSPRKLASAYVPDSTETPRSPLHVGLSFNLRTTRATHRWSDTFPLYTFVPKESGLWFCLLSNDTIWGTRSWGLIILSSDEWHAPEMSLDRPGWTDLRSDQSFSRINFFPGWLHGTPHLRGGSYHLQSSKQMEANGLPYPHT